MESEADGYPIYMKINITNLGPKEWVDFKEDISFGLLSALRSIGHDVTMSTNYFEKTALNMVVGSDFLAGMPNILQPLIRSQYDYAVFEVEAFDGATVNQRQDFPLGNYQALLLNAKHIFTPYQYNLGALGQSDWREKLRYVRWGYFPELRDDRMRRKASFTHDGLFFGLAKEARIEKLKALQASKQLSVALVGRQDPLMMRRYYIAHCRWGLNLSSGDGECFTNPFRLYAMAANDMPILSDPGPDADGYLALCEVVDFCQLEQKLLEPADDVNGLRDRVMERQLADEWRGVL